MLLWLILLGMCSLAAGYGHQEARVDDMKQQERNILSTNLMWQSPVDHQRAYSTPAWSKCHVSTYMMSVACMASTRSSALIASKCG